MSRGQGAGEGENEYWEAVEIFLQQAILCPWHGILHMPDEECPVCMIGEEHADGWEPWGKYQGRPPMEEEDL